VQRQVDAGLSPSRPFTPLSEGTEYRLSLRQADAARADLYAIPVAHLNALV
jgi:hypothetical protein